MASNLSKPDGGSASGASRRVTMLAGVTLVLATIAVYLPSLDAPFLFDDYPAVVDNPTIRDLSDLGRALSPPEHGSGVIGRPLVNLSLAVNHALGGLEVRGYHGMNLLLHALAALTLWGVLRRTLELPVLRAQFGSRAEWLAWVAALLWAVHPLQTESVVCIIQRTEIMGGLFYLLTLYCFIRSATAATARSGWSALMLAACLLGMASKEIVATVPLIVLLYDRTFLAGTFREAWRQRKGWYAALAACWLPLAWLMGQSMNRGGTAGFGLGTSSWHYLLTQCEALWVYLRLSVWPAPLVLDYGVEMRTEIGQIWPQGLLIVALLAATVTALRHKPVLGFLGAWFFVILAPSSSVVPLITQPIAEHRMYLPLAAGIVLVAGGVMRLGGRMLPAGLLVLAVAAGGLTVRRTLDYRSETALWQDTVDKHPNARVLCSLGTAYFKQGDIAGAERLYRESIAKNPNIAEAHFNLGLVLDRQQRHGEAVPCYQRAVSLRPAFAPAHAELGRACYLLGRLAEAESHLRKALALGANPGEAKHSLALVLAQQGRAAEAAACFEEVFAHNPDMAIAHHNYGLLLAELGRRDEARRQFVEAVRADPKLQVAHEMLARLRETVAGP